MDRDWWRTKYASNGEEYNFTVAHWAITEGRFRKHVKAIKEEEAAKLIHLDDMLRLHHPGRRDPPPRVRPEAPLASSRTSASTSRRRSNGKMRYYAVSRQMVLFAVERRKAWRMLQSKAGVVNKDYLAQKGVCSKRIDGGELALAEAPGQHAGTVRSGTREG